jgi:N-dimethylarginine dimethylaminohydrolase
MSGSGPTSPWGVDSEYGRLLDVLLCPPKHFRWLPTSPISQATLERGMIFDPAAAARQHAEMVSVYEGAGVRCHFLEPDPALPYQVFARDSSVMTPKGAVVTQMRQWWRRGEYAPVVDYYGASEIPIHKMITAAALEGGDVVIVEPGAALIGAGEARTEMPAARQLAGWLEDDGWEVRIEPIPQRYVHIDVLVSMLAARLAAVCVEAASSGLLDWLRAKRIEIVPVQFASAMQLGGNVVSLGGGRVLSTDRAKALNAEMKARGLQVFELDLSAFTLGGGGAHCLMQALRRERVA